MITIIQDYLQYYDHNNPNLVKLLRKQLSRISNNIMITIIQN